MNGLTLRCSELDRYWACPGSFAVSRHRRAVPKDSKASERGSLLHEVMAHAVAQYAETGEIPEDAPYEVKFCLSAVQLPEGAQVFIEVPLLSPILTGHADLIVLTDDELAVYDWKTGWAADIDTAECNMQLLGYASLAYFYKWQRPTVTVHLFCPNHPDKEHRMSSALYTEALLVQSKKLLETIWQQCKADDAMRVPNPRACRYCQGKGQADLCPESCKFMERFGAMQQQELNLPAMPQEGLLALAAQAPLAKQIADAVLAELKARMVAGEVDTPDWMLTKGRMTTTVNDVKGAWDALKPHLSQDPHERTKQFLGACRLSHAQISKVVATAAGISEKDARDRVLLALGDNVTVKTGEPSLRQCKGK